MLSLYGSNARQEPARVEGSHGPWRVKVGHAHGVNATVDRDKRSRAHVSDHGVVLDDQQQVQGSGQDVSARQS